MSTACTLIKSTTVMVTVPVDVVTIRDGMTFDRCVELEAKASADNSFVEAFKITTLASVAWVEVEIAITHVSRRPHQGNFAFVGYLSGQLVSGFYDPSTGQGWFRSLVDK